MAGRPRFLDALDPDVRARIEPQLLQRIRDHVSLDDLHDWVRGEGVAVARSTLSNFAREVRGAGAEDAARRIGRDVLSAQGPAPAQEEGGQEAPAPAPAPAEDAPIDHYARLKRQMLQAEHMASTATVVKDRLTASKLMMDLSAELREIEKAIDGARGPRVVFYFPEKVEIEMCEAVE